MTNGRRMSSRCVALLLVLTGAVVACAAPEAAQLQVGGVQDAGYVAEDVRGHGYDVSAAAILDGGGIEMLRSAAVPVLVPTWLPNWTRAVRPTVFLTAYQGGYALNWSLTPQEAAASPESATADVGSFDEPFTLLVQGDVYFQGDEADPVPASAPPWPERAGQQRAYLWDPNNDTCPGRGGPESVDDTLAQLQWDADAGVYYRIQVQPAPACSGGRVQMADLLRIADSMTPLS